MSKPNISILFRNRYMRVILLSTIFVQIGIWVRNFAVLLFVMEKTHGNPFAVSMISVAEFAPIFVFSFIGGTFADRWRPKRTMIWCDFLSGLSVFAVLVTLIFADWKAVFFATLISAILSQFSIPSGLKLFKIYVPSEQVQSGMSLYQTLIAVFMVLGPALGTFVYQSLGIKVAIAVMGVAFLLSAGIYLLLPADSRMEMEKPRTTLVRHEMLGGIRYVLSKKTLTSLGACFITIGLGAGLIQPLEIFLTTERLGLAKEYLQWLFIAYGVGVVVGGALAVSLSKTIAPQKMLALGLLVTLVGYSGNGWSTVLWLTMLFHFCNGLVLPCIQTGINTMVIQNTEESFMGRVNGILIPLYTGSMVVIMSVAGALKQWFSLVVLYHFAALFFIISLLILLPIYRLPGKIDTGKQLSAHETGENF